MNDKERNEELIKAVKEYFDRQRLINTISISIITVAAILSVILHTRC